MASPLLPPDTLVSNENGLTAAQPTSCQGSELVLITGGAGYVGFRLATYLVKQGYRVRLLDLRPPEDPLGPNMEMVVGDIRDPDSVHAACQGVTLVFHVASYGMSGQELLHTKLIQQVNVGGTENLLKACIAQGVPRLVYTSTFNTVFTGQPIINGNELIPYPNPDSYIDLYSKTKAMAEYAVLSANGTQLHAHMENGTDTNWSCSHTCSTAAQQLQSVHDCRARDQARSTELVQQLPNKAIGFISHATQHCQNKELAPSLLLQHHDISTHGHACVSDQVLGSCKQQEHPDIWDDHCQLKSQDADTQQSGKCLYRSRQERFQAGGQTPSQSEHLTQPPCQQSELDPLQPSPATAVAQPCRPHMGAQWQPTNFDASAANPCIIPPNNGCHPLNDRICSISNSDADQTSIVGHGTAGHSMSTSNGHHSHANSVSSHNSTVADSMDSSDTDAAIDTNDSPSFSPISSISSGESSELSATARDVSSDIHGSPSLAYANLPDSCLPATQCTAAASTAIEGALQLLGDDNSMQVCKASTPQGSLPTVSSTQQLTGAWPKQHTDFSLDDKECSSGRAQLPTAKHSQLLDQMPASSSSRSTCKDACTATFHSSYSSQNANLSLPLLNSNSTCASIARGKSPSQQLMSSQSHSLSSTHIPSQSHKLLTCAVRPNGIWGPGELRHLPRIIQMVRTGLASCTFGDKSSLTDWVHVDNLVSAMLLAAEGLTERKQYIAAGQTYFITDGQPINTFEFLRPIIVGLDYTHPTINLPYQLVYVIACCMEAVAHLLARVGLIFHPPLMRMEVAKVGVTHYMDISKARMELGYEPVQYDVADVVHWLKGRGFGKHVLPIKPQHHDSSLAGSIDWLLWALSFLAVVVAVLIMSYLEQEGHMDQ